MCVKLPSIITGDACSIYEIDSTRGILFTVEHVELSNWSLNITLRSEAAMSCDRQAISIQSNMPNMMDLNQVA